MTLGSVWPFHTFEKNFIIMIYGKKYKNLVILLIAAVALTLPKKCSSSDSSELDEELFTSSEEDYFDSNEEVDIDSDYCNADSGNCDSKKTGKLLLTD